MLKSHSKCAMRSNKIESVYLVIETMYVDKWITNEGEENYLFITFVNNKLEFPIWCANILT